MLCPHCNVQLIMSDRENIEIDYCPQCRGVWLDRGELDKIIERAHTTHNSQYSSADYPSRHTDDDDHRERHSHHDNHQYHGQHKKHKKESFLGDLFDF